MRVSVKFSRLPGPRAAAVGVLFGRASDSGIVAGEHAVTPCAVHVASGVRGLDVVKTFDALFAELTERARTRPADSGTVRALDDGVHAQGKKVLEEAGEVWIAAEHESDDRLAEEVSQLLYRVQVLMVGRGLDLEDVYRHL